MFHLTARVAWRDSRWDGTICRAPSCHLGRRARVSALASSWGGVGTRVIFAWMNSILVEFVLRQRMQGLHLTSHLLSQVPTPRLSEVFEPCVWGARVDLSQWLAPRVAELSVTAWPLVAFAHELVASLRPFQFVRERRLQLQCEIDAAWCMLAGLDNNEVEFMLDYLEKIRARDERQFGDYRTKLLALEIFNSMQRAVETSKPYQTILAPVPADPSIAHPDSSRPNWVQAKE